MVQYYTIECITSCTLLSLFQEPKLVLEDAVKEGRHITGTPVMHYGGKNGTLCAANLTNTDAKVSTKTTKKHCFINYWLSINNFILVSQKIRTVPSPAVKIKTFRLWGSTLFLLRLLCYGRS